MMKWWVESIWPNRYYLDIFCSAAQNGILHHTKPLFGFSILPFYSVKRKYAYSSFMVWLLH